MKIQKVTKVEKVNRQICKADGSSNPKCNDGVCSVEGLIEHFEYVHVGYVCHDQNRKRWTARGKYFDDNVGFNVSGRIVCRLFDTKKEAVNAIVYHVNSK